jgi:hypothetical protein
VDPLEAIRRAPAEFELAPGLPPADIERLAAELSVPLPDDLRALLGQTAGIDGGPLETIDFTGRSLSVAAPELPWGFPGDATVREPKSGAMDTRGCSRTRRPSSGLGFSGVLAGVCSV